MAVDHILNTVVGNIAGQTFMKTFFTITVDLWKQDFMELKTGIKDTLTHRLF